MNNEADVNITRPDSEPLPAIIAGPILRRITARQVTLWLMTSNPSAIMAKLLDEEHNSVLASGSGSIRNRQIKVGGHAYINILTLTPAKELINGQRYYYDLMLDSDETHKGLAQQLKHFVYPGQTMPGFVFNTTLTHVLHGSCRKPHHCSDDGLLAVDDLLEESLNNPDAQPDMLIMSGDQVYIDDVAGPTLNAVHQVIEKLVLFDTQLPISDIKTSRELSQNAFSFYQRNRLLPDNEANENVMSQFFLGKKKPVFTSVNANNHLISFAEVIAMYVLVWSPEMWRFVDFSDARIPDQYKPIYQKELALIKTFASGLGKVRRALAHLPVYMIFDDHDVTDDWNLTRGWEDAVYNNAFAKRIVGNALIGYWLCQGWANDVDRLEPLAEQLLPHFSEDGLQNHDSLIDKLLAWEQWHYTLDTHPKVVVLDTRTQRWRSESSLNKPSGLMDWEALCELQQELLNQPSVIMVSAAPVFGVKLIEAVQRVFTLFGKPLMVDAENWMAHKGTASVILNIFRHNKTPPDFVILSGDVHYSFVYDITLKFRKNTPHITQITSSGIKNQFPDKLLRLFDHLNRILYGPRSPLNWFTKRRYMKIRHRNPGNQKLITLLNASGIGKLTVRDGGHQVDASVIRPDGEEIAFRRND